MCLSTCVLWITKYYSCKDSTFLFQKSVPINQDLRFTTKSKTNKSAANFSMILFAGAAKLCKSAF